MRTDSWPFDLAVWLFRATHERALRILQALLNAFDARRFPVNLTAEGVRVTILDEHIGFAIEARTKTVEHRTTFADRMLLQRGLSYQVATVDHVPSGDLMLFITNVGHVRQHWSDGSRRLETILNRFIVGLVRAALSLKAPAR